MKTVLMTGGHAGLGLVGARALAMRYGCDLILAGRDRERVEQAARRLRTETGRRVDVVTMDLGSRDSVRAGATACRQLLRQTTDGGDTKLAGIVCNAGVQSHGDITYSADGYEQTFAANCLGHFLLVNVLLDALRPDARIVWTASGTHDFALLDGKVTGRAAEPNARALANEGQNGKPMSGARRYATSKLCIIMYAYELHRRLRAAGSSIASIAYDPGFLPDIGMGRGAPPVFRNPLVKFALAKLGMTIGEMPLSGEALAILDQDPAHAASSGSYYHCKDGRLGQTRSSVASYDIQHARALWDDSNELVGLHDAERAMMLRGLATGFS